MEAALFEDMELEGDEVVEGNDTELDALHRGGDGRRQEARKGGRIGEHEIERAVTSGGRRELEKVVFLVKQAVAEAAKHFAPRRAGFAGDHQIEVFCESREAMLNDRKTADQQKGYAAGRRCRLDLFKLVHGGVTDAGASPVAVQQVMRERIERGGLATENLERIERAPGELKRNLL